MAQPQGEMDCSINGSHPFARKLRDSRPKPGRARELDIVEGNDRGRRDTVNHRVKSDGGTDSPNSPG